MSAGDRCLPSRRSAANSLRLSRVFSLLQANTRALAARPLQTAADNGALRTPVAHKRQRAASPIAVHVTAAPPTAAIATAAAAAAAAAAALAKMDIAPEGVRSRAGGATRGATPPRARRSLVA